MSFDLPEDQICNLITAALQKKYIIGFVGKSGKNGGILRSNKEEPKLIIPDSSFADKSSFWDELNSTNKLNSVING